MNGTASVSPAVAAGFLSRSQCVGAVLPLILLLLAGSTASASTISGNPVADGGWTFQGNSLADGTYIRGGGNTDFNLYTTSFTLAAGSALTSNVTDAWQAGDTVLAMGGVVTTTNGIAAGWGAPFVGDAVNADLTTSERIVTKFGTQSTSWGASTIAPSTGTSPFGNGLGATSNGDGSNGAILLGTLTGDLTLANSGVLQGYGASDTSQVYKTADSNVGDTISKTIGQYIFNVDPTTHVITSWEVFLDTTKLAGLALGVPVPAVGDRIDQALQRSTNATQFTDALGTIALATPEPSSLALAVLGTIGLFLASRRRRT
jgi:PEP-CTERM motif